MSHKVYAGFPFKKLGWTQETYDNLSVTDPEFTRFYNWFFEIDQLNQLCEMPRPIRGVLPTIPTFLEVEHMSRILVNATRDGRPIILDNTDGKSEYTPPIAYLVIDFPLQTSTGNFNYTGRFDIDLYPGRVVLVPKGSKDHTVIMPLVERHLLPSSMWDIFMKAYGNILLPIWHANLVLKAVRCRLDADMQVCTSVVRARVSDNVFGEQPRSEVEPFELIG